jgi:hypothetical protein
MLKSRLPRGRLATTKTYSGLGRSLRLLHHSLALLK